MRAEPEHAAPASAGDDSVPSEPQLPSHDQLNGRMMPWKQPLVVHGELIACSECGAYRGLADPVHP
ncbi:hypothetical protein GCM10009802_67680 [Streptomyces synnematoformans]|uniref:Uncharacterized protein n=1 Tax=Streptomyces synnematoformans TaxID=415721 RepID=A0ABN2AGE0_9ACTN